MTPTPFARAPVLAPPVATPEPPPPAAPVQVKEPETAPVASASAPKTAKAKRPKREIKDPLSRKALVLVGANTGAESYWLYAINNKDLPAEERADLIEDLNEEGFSDPDNPSREDLPLIISRLALITRHAPFARDSSNAEAFAEAYKDLMNMYYRLSE